ncbi:hypothetical protein EI034_23765 [Escherichia coli]|nr:hypothetical protein [Escherichia coli]MXD22845.1 hypothetical protein [Escherichia coli]
MKSMDKLTTGVAYGTSAGSDLTQQ